MIKDEFFTCPLCHQPLSNTAGQMACLSGHTYDIAKEGYVNLLLANMKKSANPGDSAEMVRSRRRFLDMGYYSRLGEIIADKTSRLIEASVAPEGFTLLDAGCGEGYYLSTIERNTPGSGIKLFAMDISREAVRLAAKRVTSASFAVASLYSMPCSDNSADCILSVFSPIPAEEFRRVLAPGGAIIHVHPGEKHLLSLRNMLFPEIKPLRKEDRLAGIFTLQSEEELEYEISIEGREKIADIVSMTPYNWKTVKKVKKTFIDQAENLKTTAHFIISTYSK